MRFAIGVLTALTLCPAARASSVRVDRGATGSVMTFRAAAHERNQVAVQIEASDVLVHDQGAQLAVGTGCTSKSAHEAVCQVVTDVIVRLGDGDDSAGAGIDPGVAVPRVAVYGGPGNDVLDGFGAPKGELLDGGSGNDALTVGGPIVARGGAGNDIFNTVGQVSHALISCGAGRDEFPDYIGPPLVTRECEWALTSDGGLRIAFRGPHLSLTFPNDGCAIIWRLGRHGPAKTTRGPRAGRPVTFTLTHPQRPVSVWSKQRCVRHARFLLAFKFTA